MSGDIKHNQESDRKRPPLFLVLMSVLLALFVLVGLSFMWVAQSPEANRWLLKQVSAQLPELTFEKVSGSLAHRLGFSMRYETDGFDLQIEKAVLQLKPSCFWNLSLCVQTFHADLLAVHLTSTDSTSDEPVQLPELSTPVLFRLSELKLNRLLLTLDEQPIIDEKNLSASARWIGPHLRISDLQATDELCLWGLDGSLRFTRRYPLQATISCDTEQFPFRQLNATAKGDLDQLTAKLITAGALHSQLDINAGILQPDLPMEFRFELSQPFLLRSVEGMEQDHTQITHFSVNGHGNLNQLILDAAARLETDSVKGPVSLSMQGSSSLQQLTVQALKIQLPKGTALTQGTLAFTEGVHWNGSSRLEQVDFGQFTDELSGHVSGDISQAIALNEQLKVELELMNLAGTLNQQPWQAEGKLAWFEDQITLNKVQFSQTRNQLQANGHFQLQGSSDLSVQFDLNDLSYIMPDLAGQIDGDIRIGGSLQAPHVGGSINGNNLQYQAFKLGLLRSRLNWKTDSRANNRISTSITGLAIGDRYKGNIQLGWEGQLKQHQILLSLQDDLENELELICDGNLSLNTDSGATAFEQWNAQCRKLNVLAALYRADFMWQLQKPFSISVKQTDRVQVSPFCLFHSQADTTNSTLCLQSPLLWQHNQLADLAVLGQNLKADWAQPWLPENAKLSGNLQLSMELEQPSGELKAHARIHSTDTDILLQSGQDNLPGLKVPFQQLELDARFDQENWKLDWQLESSVAGTSRAELAVQKEHLQGHLTFANFKIEPFARLALPDESDRIVGELNGRIVLGGTVGEPQISGSLSALNGRVSSLSLPLPVEDITLHMDFRQNKARLQGQFSVAEKQGNLNGEMEWLEDTWRSNMHITAETLLFKPQDGVTVNLIPDVTFRMAPGNLVLQGEVRVPEARVFVRKLPEQAISASPDVEIVNAGSESRSRLNVSSDFTLLLGDDVKFEGFGLETFLTGKMQVSQKNNGLLRSKGVIRLERGAYQAYGQQLTISNGDLIFIDALDNPQLRLSAVRDNTEDNVTVGIRVSGRAQSPEITVFSIPEMPQQEKLHYLITGRSPNADAAAGSSVAAEAALSLALQQNTGNLTRKAGEAVGIENLTLSAGSTENRSEVGLSGYITPDLMIRYGVGMFEAVNTLSLKYRIQKNLYFEVISGKNNAFDLLWSFDRE